MIAMHRPKLLHALHCGTRAKNLYAPPWVQAARLIALWLMGLMAWSMVQAQAPQPFAPWAIHNLAVLEDPQGRETIETVSHPSREADFKAVSNGFSAGYTRSVHWLRFTLPPPPVIDADTSGPEAYSGLLEILPPVLDDVRLYVPRIQKPGSFTEWRAGDTLPYAEREFKHRGFVHRIAFTDQQPLTVYLRLETNGSSVFHLGWTSLPQFLTNSAREHTILGALLGVLLASLLLNVQHHQWLRREAIYQRFLWFQGATLLVLLGINGVVSAMFPRAPWVANYWVPLSFMVTGFLSVRFHILALRLETGPRWILRLCQGFMALTVLLMLLTLLGYLNEAMRILMVSSMVVLMVGCARSFQLWRQHVDEGKLLYMSHIFRLVGSLAGALTILGIVPGGLWSYHSFEIGTLASMLTLQLMIGQRMRQLDAERHRATAAAELSVAIADKERAAHEQQRHFLAMLTHELKTPLSVIRMRLGAQSPSQRMQVHAQSAVEEIDGLVERCALVSRIDEQQLHTDLQTCNMTDVLVVLRAQCRQPHRVALTLAQSSEPIHVLTDILWLRTVLSNLIDNALKYSPPESTITIALTTQNRGGADGVQVSVSNTLGTAGIPDEQLLFDKYYRSPGARFLSGSGLGLYIVKQLVDFLGGQIKYLPEPPHITFQLWLPLCPKP